MTKLRDKRALRKLPAEHPARLAALVKLLAVDLERLRAVEALAPHFADFDAAVERAERVLRLPQELEEAEQAEHAGALRKAVAVLKRGGVPKLAERHAPIDVTLACQAAEQSLLDAHAATIEQARDSWPSVRRQIIDDARQAHAAAAEAVQNAAAAVGKAQAAYGAVPALDADLLARDADKDAQARAEVRMGIPWYESTHSAAAPLRNAVIRDVRIPIAEVLQALEAAVADPDAALPAADWSPLNDPEHDARRDEPLNLEAGWVRAAVRRQSGTSCATCLQPNAEVVVEQAGALVLVHERCRDGKLTDGERRTAERLARYQRTGYPAQP